MWGGKEKKFLKTKKRPNLLPVVVEVGKNLLQLILIYKEVSLPHCRMLTYRVCRVCLTQRKQVEINSHCCCDFLSGQSSAI